MTDWGKLAKTLYPNADDGDWLCFSDYDPIIGHFGEVALQISYDSWCGDTRVLYKDTGRGFGYLCIGWGSCSGCDALQSSHTYKELADLICVIEAGIIWMSRASLLTFLRDHDWAGDYARNDDNQKEFVQQAINYLETANGQ